MSFLLDTHVLLWWLSNPQRLSERVQEVIGDSRNIVFVSAASIWEIEIKVALGKLRIPADLEIQLEREQFQELPIHWAHTRAIAALPSLHRDPFDRLLLAQAKVEKLTLISSDSLVLAYKGKNLDAG